MIPSIPGLVAAAVTCAAAAPIPSLPHGTLLFVSGITISDPCHKEIAKMTKESTQLVAQAILRRADGSSILDTEGGITSANIEQFAVEPERIEDAVQRLEERGFSIEARDQYTLSLAGPARLFENVFGLREVVQKGAAPFSAAHVPPELADVIADVMIPAPPQYFC